MIRVCEHAEKTNAKTPGRNDQNAGFASCRLCVKQMHCGAQNPRHGVNRIGMLQNLKRKQERVPGSVFRYRCEFLTLNAELGTLNPLNEAVA